MKRNEKERQKIDRTNRKQKSNVAGLTETISKLY